MNIDPLETIIHWLAGALTSVNGRVAGKHRYGETWKENETGVSVHLDQGSPDLYAPVQAPRLELRIYADDQVKVVRVWQELVALSRSRERFTVSTSQGAALVQYFVPRTGLSIPYDDVLRMDVGVVFFEAMISEEAVV